MPRSTSLWDTLVAAGYSNKAYMLHEDGWDNAIWQQLIASPDQLRQRLGLALLDFLVVSINGLPMPWRQFAMASYMDVLLDNAFGNFRTLLGAITTNAAMAVYLTFLDNQKAVPQGSQPDENYARELMQLFTIGLHELNLDGTEKLGPDGRPIETYSQTDVSQLARVFTGLTYTTKDSSTPDRYRQPLVMNVKLNEVGSTTFLGHVVRGGRMAAIDKALDIIFAHPNVPPFVSKNLIKRLVTSNPSPAYVGRVAAAFADNGKGVRGDLKAVVRAILTDSEARDLPPVGGPNAGKLRDPVQRLTNWARAFKASSATGIWGIGNLTQWIGQSPGRSPSVFNFFQPGYAPPHTAISDLGLVAPEFQITTEQSVINCVTCMFVAVARGMADVTPNYSDMLALASDSEKLVGEINLVLAAGQLREATVNTIVGLVDSIPMTSWRGPDRRVQTAALMTLASPDYLILT
jgi:uncharacterized protein (DUF1800 family)